MIRKAIWVLTALNLARSLLIPMPILGGMFSERNTQMAVSVGCRKAGFALGDLATIKLSARLGMRLRTFHDFIHPFSL